MTLRSTCLQASSWRCGRRRCWPCCPARQRSQRCSRPGWRPTSSCRCAFGSASGGCWRRLRRPGSCHVWCPVHACSMYSGMHAGSYERRAMMRCSYVVRGCPRAAGVLLCATAGDGDACPGCGTCGQAVPLLSKIRVIRSCPERTRHGCTWRNPCAAVHPYTPRAWGAPERT